jgi:hypothetical protein
VYRAEQFHHIKEADSLYDLPLLPRSLRETITGDHHCNVPVIISPGLYYSRGPVFQCKSDTATAIVRSFTRYLWNIQGFFLHTLTTNASFIIIP